jgi:hypothetical protein
VKSVLPGVEKRYSGLRKSGTLARGAYLERSIEPLLLQLLAEIPALLLVGPRASGKTTTAARNAKSIVRLDRPAEAAAFRADPDVALRGLAEPCAAISSSLCRVDFPRRPSLSPQRCATGGSKVTWINF